MDRIDPPARIRPRAPPTPQSARTTARRLTAAGFSLLASSALRPERAQTRPSVWVARFQLWSYAVPAPGPTRGRRGSWARSGHGCRSPPPSVRNAAPPSCGAFRQKPMAARHNRGPPAAEEFRTRAPAASRSVPVQTGRCLCLSTGRRQGPRPVCPSLALRPCQCGRDRRRRSRQGSGETAR